MQAIFIIHLATYQQHMYYLNRTSIKPQASPAIRIPKCSITYLFFRLVISELGTVIH